MAGAARAEKLFEERDLAVTTDFRAVLAEISTRHFGTKADQFDARVSELSGQRKGIPGDLQGGIAISTAVNSATECASRNWRRSCSEFSRYLAAGRHKCDN